MHYSVSGDVTIHEGAAIAPGVLLLADPNSRIVIHAHACIGTGTILHAHDGTLEIGEGSVLGVGVLLVGALQVGDRACIGSATTVFNCSIKKGAIVASGSLLGVNATFESCHCEVSSDPEDDEVFAPGFCPPPPPVAEPKESEPSEPASDSPEPSPEPTEQSPASSPEDSDEIESPIPQVPLSEPTQNGAVYGQMYVNQLLVKLFPHQQRLNSLSDPQNDPSNDPSADEG